MYIEYANPLNSGCSSQKLFYFIKKGLADFDCLSTDKLSLCTCSLYQYEILISHDIFTLPSAYINFMNV